MDLTDERGAEAAARYFLELYEYVVTTGDTAEWDAMSGEACGFCAGVKEDTLANLADGAVRDGGRVTVRKVEVGYDDLLDGYPVHVDYSQAPATRTSRAGAVEHEDGSAGTMQVDLIVVDSRWRVLHVARDVGAGGAS